MTWCLYYTVVQSDSGCRPVGNQLGSDRQPIGDRSATVSLAFVFDCRKSATFWRSVGNRSAISRRLKLCRDCLQQLQLVGDQSPTSRRPPKTFLRPIWSQRGFTCSNQNLLATKSSLQPSATCRRPPCNRPATSLRPPEILVARRSPTGCKLCVTGALPTAQWGYSFKAHLHYIWDLGPCIRAWAWTQSKQVTWCFVFTLIWVCVPRFLSRTSVSELVTTCSNFLGCRRPRLCNAHAQSRLFTWSLLHATKMAMALDDLGSEPWM